MNSKEFLKYIDILCYIAYSISANNVICHIILYRANRNVVDGKENTDGI